MIAPPHCCVGMAVLLALFATTPTLAGTGAALGSGSPEPAAVPQPPVEQVVRQGFPVRESQGRPLECAETAWVIDWDVRRPENNVLPSGKRKQPSSGLWIRSAKFMYKDACGKTRWITVLENLLVDALHAQYHDNRGYSDMWRHIHFMLPGDKELLGPRCVDTGRLLRSDDCRKDCRVYREVHDDGLRWADRGVTRGRRGEKLFLWCLVGGGNYTYVTEFGFRDDGVITCRVGATGEDRGPDSPGQEYHHLHITGWRWDMILGDPDDEANGAEEDNRVRLVRRVPAERRFYYETEVIPFPDGRGDHAEEGGADWVPDQMTMLRFESRCRTNAEGHAVAYDVIPTRHGEATCLGDQGDPRFASKEFWVTTRERSLNSRSRCMLEVPELAADRCVIDCEPTTAWYSSPLFHIPRDEDFGAGGVATRGVALTAWAGFMIRPRNLFDRTPLYTSDTKGE